MAYPFLCGPKEGLDFDYLVDVGALGCRITADPNYAQEAYMRTLSEQGGETLITFDQDSFPEVNWDAVRHNPLPSLWEDVAWRQLEWYYNIWSEKKPLIINIWNEWRGSGGDEESPMHASVINRLLEMTRAVFGDKQLLAHGSTVDGNPASLELLDWTHANLCDLHLYGKVSPSWEHDKMTGVFDLDPYYAVLPEHVTIMCSEIGLSSWPEYDPGRETEESLEFQARYAADILGHCFQRKDLLLVAWFAGHNHRGFGLRNNDGIAKPAYYEYRHAAHDFITPVLKGGTVPEQRFDVGSGLLAMMAEDGAKPIVDSTFLPLGRQPAQMEISHADNGIEYKWSLILNKGWRVRP